MSMKVLYNKGVKMIKFLRLLEKLKIINQKRTFCEILTDGRYLLMFRPINFTKLQIEYKIIKIPNIKSNHYLYAKIANDTQFKIKIA